MAATGCHAETESPRDRAKALILKTLGAKRVADWCGVGEDTVYAWLSRGSDENPIPSSRVPEIMRGAKAEGLHAPLAVLAVLWPDMAGAIADG